GRSLPNSEGLKRRVLRAGTWTVVGYGLGQGLRFGGNLIMARLLVPEMFGVMAIATMIHVVLFLLSDIGLRQNIVQSPRGSDPRFLDNAWTTQIVRGAMLWSIAIAVSVLLTLANKHAIFPSTSTYAASELPLVIAASCFSAVILGFQSTKMA